MLHREFRRLAVEASPAGSFQQQGPFRIRFAIRNFLKVADPMEVRVGEIEVPEGCRFQDRCPLVIDKCRTQEPPLEEMDGHRVACWRADEVRLES